MCSGAINTAGVGQSTLQGVGQSTLQGVGQSTLQGAGQSTLQGAGQSTLQEVRCTSMCISSLNLQDKITWFDFNGITMVTVLRGVVFRLIHW